LARHKSEIRSFHGLVNFYRSYIKDCADICAPLTFLTRKKVKFKWDENCNNAFLALKKALTSPPVLGYPTRDGYFVLETDASGFATGAILSQVQGDREMVIAYASQTLSKSERNFCTTMREMLAVVSCVRHFRHYLLGRPFTIRTDHASLCWLKNVKNAEGLLGRWLSILDTFDYTIEYCKRTRMQHVDALSRIPKHCKNGDCIDCGLRERCRCSTPGHNDTGGVYWRLWPAC